MKKIFLCILSLLLVVSSAACGYSDEKEALSLELDGKNKDYAVRYSQLPIKIAQLTAECSAGEMLLLGGLSMSYKPVLGALKDYENFSAFELPQSVKYIYAICPYNDSYAVLAGDAPQSWVKDGNLTENNQETYSISILTYKENGELEKEIPITGEGTAQGENFYSLLFLKNSFYLLSSHTLLRCSTDGVSTEIINDTAPRFISQCIYKDTYTVAQFDHNTGNAVISASDSLENLDTSNIIQLPEEYREIIGLGTTKAGYLLLNTDENLYIVNDNGDCKKILCWGELGIMEVDYRDIFESSRGYELFSPNMTELEFAGYGAVNEKRRNITVWVDSPATRSEMSNIISTFNATNKEYVATVYEYSNEDADRLKAEIAAGEGPDVFCYLGSHALENAKDENFCEDLLPYLDNDPDFSRDSLLSGILNVCIDRGRLYKLPHNFMLYSYVVPKDLGLEPGYTMSEFIAAARNYAPELPLMQTYVNGRYVLWTRTIDICLSAFVDKDNTKCDFNSERYIDMLKGFKEALPKEPVEGAPQKSLAMWTQIGTALRLKYFSETYGENYMYIGAPCGRKSNGICLSSCMSISSQSQNKEGAWQLLRHSMSGSVPYYSDLSFPAAKEQFNAYMDYAMSGEMEDGIIIKQYDVDELERAVSEADTLMDDLIPIQEIANEEAEKYFNDVYTAEEAAEHTQARASIFLSEQYG